MSGRIHSGASLESLRAHYGGDPWLPVEVCYSPGIELSNRDGVVSAGRQFFAPLGMNVSEELAYEVQRLFLVASANPGSIYAVQWGSHLVRELNAAAPLGSLRTDTALSAVAPNTFLFGVRVFAKEKP